MRPRRRGARSATAIGMCAVVSLLGVSAGSSVSIAAPGSGSISGTVKGVKGHPIAGICVRADSIGVGTARLRTKSAANGTFSLVKLLPGSYTVRFGGCGVTKDYATQYYDNRGTLGTAVPVEVTAGHTTAGVDATMVLGGTLSGTVRDSDTNDPIAGICVRAYATTGGKPLISARSGSQGTYALSGLAAGTYAVRFSGCGISDYVGQFYDDEGSLTSADPVTVKAGEDTKGIGALMVQGGSISGTVTDYSDPPAPLDDICVSAVVYGGGDGGPRTPAGASSTDGTVRTTTNAEGDYGFPALYPDTYELSFADCHHHKHLAESYSGHITVTSGSSSTAIDVAMPLPGSISGTVTSSATEKICVGAGDSEAKVAPGGSYTLKRLYPGSYAVEFGSCKRFKYIYVDQYYDDQPINATPVPVTSGANTPNINAAMILGGDIAGKVTNDNMFATVVIEAVSTSGGQSGEVDINTNEDPTGTYSISGLIGDYDVYFFYGVNGVEKVPFKKNPVVVESAVTRHGVNRTIPSGD